MIVEFLSSRAISLVSAVSLTAQALAAELEKSIVVDSRCIPGNVVTMNSRVRFEDRSTGAICDVTVVFPNEVDASQGKVSVLDPIGTALLGLSVGQTILWPFPDGSTRSLRVLKLIYRAEADEIAGPDIQRE